MIITVDCWGTLLKASPTFKSTKVKLVKEYFPSLNEKDEFIIKCFNDTKKLFNDVIENSGGCQPTVGNVFTYLFSKLNMGYQKYNFLSEFIEEYQYLASQDGPTIYSDETLEFIEKLSKDANLVISSNTMFIRGEVLLEMIAGSGLAKYFKDALFSDQLQVAKPHKAMYRGSQFHIGDNEITDVIGANNAGSTGILINSNEKTIIDAYNLIIQK
jgi:FMN phosphatase YigB (HAD superfamily)